MHVVTVPVANLRRDPIEHTGQYTKDPLQESQVLFGEPLLALEEAGEWIRVQAIEQQKFSNSWTGYPGWIQKHQVQQIQVQPTFNLITTDLWSNIQGSSANHTLSFGTKLQGISEQADQWSVKLPDGSIGSIQKAHVKKLAQNPNWQSEIVSYGKRFLDFPYLWGGRSAYDPKSKTCITSVDCSGYVQLLYRVVRGMDIPRDAHDQYLKAQKVEQKDLLIGDLIFFEPKERPGRMNHVMMYAGDGHLLEATMASESVRQISLEQRLTVDCPYNIYFGRYI